MRTWALPFAAAVILGAGRGAWPQPAPDSCSGMDEGSCKALQGCSWTLRGAEVCDCPYANSDGSCPADCGVKTEEVWACEERDAEYQSLDAVGRRWYDLLERDARREGYPKRCGWASNMLRDLSAYNLLAPSEKRGLELFLGKRCGSDPEYQSLGPGERASYDYIVAEMRRGRMTCGLLPQTRKMFRSALATERELDLFEKRHCRRP